MQMSFLFSVNRVVVSWRFKSRRSSGVECFLGKEEVVGSIPIVGSQSVTCIFKSAT